MKGARNGKTALCGNAGTIKALPVLRRGSKYPIEANEKTS
jgi:hypothetical protein